MKKQHVRPGERNPIEGKFGQGKTAYGFDSIKARLKDTSESWIACIFLVINLVKLARIALLCLLVKIKAQTKRFLSFKQSQLKQWLNIDLWPLFQSGKIVVNIYS